MNCVKKFDSSLIPPCKEVLFLKIKIVHLIVRRWASAIAAHPLDDGPEEFGWTFSNNGKYIIKWFEGPAAPRVLDVTISKIPNLQQNMILKVLIKLSLYKFVFAVY